MERDSKRNISWISRISEIGRLMNLRSFEYRYDPEWNLRNKWRRTSTSKISGVSKSMKFQLSVRRRAQNTVKHGWTVLQKYPVINSGRSRNAHSPKCTLCRLSVSVILIRLYFPCTRDAVPAAIKRSPYRFFGLRVILVTRQRHYKQIETWPH